MKLKKKFLTGFTLIEVMMGILIVSIVMTAGLYALNSVTVGKVKLIEKTFLEKQAFLFSERLFETIKKGGTIDYEEYFNRDIVDTTSFSAGHYDTLSGFGNFGRGGNVGTTSYGQGLYYCISKLGDRMGVGCVSDYNSREGGPTHLDYSGHPQRYRQYEFQFADFNSDIDSSGDEDGDGTFLDDDDDEYLGIGPEVFADGSFQRELYLINGLGNERTFFRWTVIVDPDKPTADVCNFSTPSAPTGSGCLGRIEFLKLQGKDYGYDHNIATIDADGSQFDGKVDTWIIHPDFTSNSTEVIAGSNNTNYWQALLSDTIHVDDVRFYPYPNKESGRSWRDNSAGILVSPYVRISMKLQPSWKVKRKIVGDVPTIDIASTINLTDIFSN